MKGIEDDITRMIVVKGLRRTGKSSLIKVALNTIRKPYIIVDARTIVFTGIESFYDILGRELEKIMVKYDSGYRLRNTLSRITEISIAGTRIVFREKKPSTLLEVLEALNEWSSENNVKTVIVFDEAQELRIIKGFRKLLAHIYDYLDSLKIVLAGSEIGVLDRLVGLNDPKAPLYGRPRLEIETKRLSRGKALDFLEKGFSELGIKPRTRDLEESVEVLDGIIGWLTMYGYYAVKTNHREALKKTIIEGSKLVLQEIENFLELRRQARRRYTYILKLLSEPRTWSEIRDSLSILLGRRIHQQQVTRYLKELVDYGFIVKENGKYKLADPLIREAVKTTIK